jgi:hypothetical protein
VFYEAKNPGPVANRSSTSSTKFKNFYSRNSGLHDVVPRTVTFYLYKLTFRMRNSGPLAAAYKTCSEFGIFECQFAELKQVPDANCYSCDSVLSL